MLKIRHIAKLFVLCFVIIGSARSSLALTNLSTRTKIPVFVASFGNNYLVVGDTLAINDYLYLDISRADGSGSSYGYLLRINETDSRRVWLDYTSSDIDRYGANIHDLTQLNNNLYYFKTYWCNYPIDPTCYDAYPYSQLHYTTASMTNTALIKEFPDETTYVVTANNLLLFDNDNDLWRSDGTSAWTTKVKDFQSITSIVGAGNLAYFTADNSSSGTELWKTDGTNAGTTLVKDIVAGSESSNPQALTVSGNLLYFTTNPTTDTVRLWRSDGTANGTFMLKDFANDFEVLHLTDVDGTLYFTYANELWHSKGTTATTNLVHDLADVSSTRNFTSVQGLLYFKATTANGEQLWRSNGTDTGTYPLVLNDIGQCAYSRELAEFDGLLYFGICDGVNAGLWSTNGTDSGMHFVSSHVPTYLVSTNSHLYFFTEDAVDGNNFWKLTNVTSVVYIPLVQR